MAPLDFSGYVPGIVNNGPGYRPPTVIEICQSLELQIKFLKKQLGDLSEDDFDTFMQTVTDSLNSLGDALEALQGDVDAIELVLPAKEDTANKTGTIDSGSTSAQYPTAAAVYSSLLALYQDIEELLRLKANGYTNGAAKLSAAIPYGECDSTSTATAFTATVPGITELKDGVCMLLKNGVVTSASGFTIDINSLGAKGVYNNMTASTRETTLFNVAYTMLFIYSEDLDGWILYRGYDANTNTIGYQVRTNSTRLVAADQIGRYRLLFSSADLTKWVPANTSSSTSATAAKTPNTRAINPFGLIRYYGYNTIIAAGSMPAAYMWQQYVVTLGYSFTPSTLTDNKPLYLKCTPQADGSTVINSTTPYTQTLPTAADGSIYILLGIATSTTAFELLLEHPVYYHDGTALRIWTGPVS